MKEPTTNALGWLGVFMVTLIFGAIIIMGPEPGGTSAENAQLSSLTSIFNTNSSPYKGTIFISKGDGTKKRFHEENYFEVTANKENTSGIPLSDFSVLLADTKFSISGVANIPNFGKPSETSSIYLLPREQAIISLAESPIGYNFRENRCTGYFGEFQTFVPRLEKKCPLLSLPSSEETFPLRCVSYLSQIGQCETPRTLPLSIPKSCRDTIYREASYSSCVLKGINDFDFLLPIYRIYLGTKIDTSSITEVLLLDSEDRVVDRFTIDLEGLY